MALKGARTYVLLSGYLVLALAMLAKDLDNHSGCTVDDVYGQALAAITAISLCFALFILVLHAHKDG